MTALPRLLALLWLAYPSLASAHQLDEYLQSTLVTVETNAVRLQINLTPGVAVAEQILALIDRNHDGVISMNEAAKYAHSLKRNLVVRLDQHILDLNPTAIYVPTPDELRTGWGIIQLEFVGNFGPLTGGAHRVTIENRHLTTLSVYLINATPPKSAAIQITAQDRNQTQSTGEIDFIYHAPARASGMFGMIAAPAALLITSLAGMWLIAKRRGRKQIV